MTAAFKAIAGSIGAPGISFTSDATAGAYLPATGQLGLVAKSLGLLINSSIYCVTAAAVQAGGTGYAVGDTITETGGTAISQAVLTVATLSGSAVATVTVSYPGFYTAKPSDPVAQGSTSGSGSGATFNMTWAAQYANSIVTSEAGALPWQRLGASSFVSGLMAKAKANDFVRSLVTIGSGLTLSTATNPPTLTTTLNPTLVPNYISGLTMSTAGSSTTMTIAAGVANDSTNVSLMNLSSAINKTTASWAVGSGNGGLDTGAIANNTWYHFYVITRLDTGVVDVIFSLNGSSAPTLPANYTLSRRIGTGRTNGSGQWVAFTQFGNDFLWLTPSADIATTTLGASPTTFGILVPTGVRVFAQLTAFFQNAAAGTSLLVQSPDVTGAGPSGAAGLLTARNSVAAVGVATGHFTIRTNTFAQIVAYSDAANSTFNVSTRGWTDLRGFI